MPITVHQNESIMASNMVLEEHYFVNCKLKNCRLFYSGGGYEFLNTTFENCAWTFVERAKDTVQLLVTIGMLKPGQTPPQNIQAASGSPSKMN